MLSLIGSALKGLGYIIVSTLVLIGGVAIAIKVGELYGQAWWTKEQLDPLFVTWGLLWREAKAVLETLTWALAAFGLVAALGRLKTIAKLVSDFRESKGSIFELSTTISGVKSTATAVQDSANSLGAEVRRLSDLAPIVTSTAEKLEDALKQLADLQRLAISEQGAVKESDGGLLACLGAALLLRKSAAVSLRR